MLVSRGVKKEIFDFDWTEGSVNKLSSQSWVGRVLLLFHFYNGIHIIYYIIVWHRLYFIIYCFEQY